MRIVHVIDYYQPKMGYQETFLALEHKKLGHEVHVVTSDRYHPRPHYAATWQPVLGPRLQQAGVSDDAGITIHRLEPAFEFGTRIWLKQLEPTLLSLVPALIIVHGMGSFTAVRMARLAPKLGAGAKLVFDSHASDANSRHPLRHLFYAFYRLALAPLFVRNASAIVGVENERMDFLARRYGIPEEAMVMIPVGASPDRFYRDPPARDQLRAEWGYGEQDVVLTYVGKIERRKAVDVLLRAGLQIGARKPNVRLVIIGSGDTDYIQEMKQQVELAGGLSNVNWLGAVPNDQLFRYYSAADISVWPMMISVGTLEAMACGLPLIVADVPILRDRVSHGNGMTYRPGDVHDLVSKLEELIADPERRRKMGEAGRALIEQELNWTAIAQRFIEVAN
jgi:glycosyltransferase involved in cell wall biosynthesis